MQVVRKEKGRGGEMVRSDRAVMSKQILDNWPETASREWLTPLTVRAHRAYAATLTRCTQAYNHSSLILSHM